MKYIFCLLLFAPASNAASPATAVSIDPNQSALILVTHKGGLFSGMAHDHIVYAREFQTELSHDLTDVNLSRVQFSFLVADLKIDHAPFSKTWFPRLKELGLIKTLSDPLSESDIKGITKTMLGEGQLHQAKNPEIRGEVLNLVPAKSPPFTHTAKVRVSIKQKPVERDCPVKVEVINQKLIAEAVCKFKFTDFGIEPISLFLGAVKNKDEFHLYAKIVQK